MVLLADEAGSQRQVGGHGDGVAAMVWRRHGRMLTYVDGQLCHDAGVAAWVARVLRQELPFAALFLADLAAAGDPLASLH